MAGTERGQCRRFLSGFLDWFFLSNAWLVWVLVFISGLISMLQQFDVHVFKVFDSYVLAVFMVVFSWISAVYWSMYIMRNQSQSKEAFVNEVAYDPEILKLVASNPADVDTEFDRRKKTAVMYFVLMITIAIISLVIVLYEWQIYRVGNTLDGYQSQLDQGVWVKFLPLTADDFQVYNIRELIKYNLERKIWAGIIGTVLTIGHVIVKYSHANTDFGRRLGEMS